MFVFSSLIDVLKNMHLFNFFFYLLFKIKYVMLYYNVTDLNYLYYIWKEALSLGFVYTIGSWPI